MLCQLTIKYFLTEIISFIWGNQLWLPYLMLFLREWYIARSLANQNDFTQNQWMFLLSFHFKSLMSFSVLVDMQKAVSLRLFRVIASSYIYIFLSLPFKCNDFLLYFILKALRRIFQTGKVMPSLVWYLKMILLHEAVETITYRFELT